MADEAFDTRALGEALDTVAATAAPTSTSTPQEPPPPINVLSNDVLVSIFLALEDRDWVRRTIPLVCKDWAELYRSKDASPLHEMLRVDFAKEVDTAVEAGGKGAPPLVHGSRVISWAERRAGSVRTLIINGVEDGATKDFSFKEMGRLVTVAAPSLFQLVFAFDLYINSQVRSELRLRRGGHYVLPDLKPFWKAVRDSVAPAGRLRSLMVTGADFSEADLRPLGQLAGSLSSLELRAFDFEDPHNPRPGDPGIPRRGIGLPRFPELICDLTELKWLILAHHRKIEAIPAEISSLKKLKVLCVYGCRLSSLPKELGELSALTTLRLGGNVTLGLTPEDEAFPAALGRMKSLKSLFLNGCGLRAVPAFVGELASLEVLYLHANWNLANAPQHRAFPAALGRLKSLRRLNLFLCGLRTFPAIVGELESLEELDLRYNDFEVDAAALDALLKRCRRLREVDLTKGARSWTAESLANLETFKAKLLKENPGAKVTY